MKEQSLSHLVKQARVRLPGQGVLDRVAIVVFIGRLKGRSDAHTFTPGAALGRDDDGVVTQLRTNELHGVDHGRSGVALDAHKLP